MISILLRLHFLSMPAKGMNTLFVRSYSLSRVSTKSAKEIRREFLDYFSQDLGHTVIRSSPVAPCTDNTLSFVNAGMNQFKGIFLDYYAPPVMKATNSQKCIRVGGKHNDLNAVGNDTYHHTFFEMLGNWSFSNYFKEEACKYAWNLLTNVYGIRKEFLYVTYFAGDEKLGLQPDNECKDIWLQLGVSEDKVLPFGIQENLWEMGFTGPCGPCTEIHVDCTKQLTNRSAYVNKGYSDLLELWNIVFIQYERLKDGSVVHLPKCHVDTGMGLERLVAFLQGKRSNYDTDLFQPLFETIHKCTKVQEYKGVFNNDTDGKIDYGYRTLADHARMITVALADGIMPEENHKLRRVLRRAIDVGKDIFKKDKILSELSYVIAESLGDVYPELQQNLKQVQTIIEFEEDLFKRLKKTSEKQWKKLVEMRSELNMISDWTSGGLIDGYKYLQNMLKDLQKTGTLSGNVAFKLYDTYGLNVDTIAELAQIESLIFDEVAFHKELDDLRYRSKIGLQGFNEVLTKNSLQSLKEKHVPKTDDSLKYQYTFNGSSYVFSNSQSKFLNLLINGNLASEQTENNVTYIDMLSNAKNNIGIILDKTPFYSLEGGQTSDKGIIQINNVIFHVEQVRKVDGYVIHFGYFDKKSFIQSNQRLQIGDVCTVSINPEIRQGAMLHHTGTHLLNAALKQVLGAAYQKGSVVSTDSLHFQFNPFGKKLTTEHFAQIEELINNVIKNGTPVTTKILNSSELLAEDNITFIPGEVYPHTGIRVIEIVSDNLKSKEPCCGTHVHNTSALQHFCFLHYTSKGAANRSVKAALGPSALSVKTAGEIVLREISGLENKIDNISYEAIVQEINKIRNKLNDKEQLLPYLMKEECLVKLESLSKSAWIKVKETEKTSIITEITDSNLSTRPFIIHCLQNHPKYLSLNEIISYCPKVPVLIISRDNDSVKARCSVPKETTSNNFNAQSWIEIVLRTFNANPAKDNKKSNPLSTMTMQLTNVSPDCLESLVKKAITESTQFASVHMKKMATDNKVK